jgi:chemotaxis protein MotA
MKPRRRAGRLDLLATAGIPVSLALILAGQMLEGGRAHTLFQLTAALIVFGGTAGAVMVSFSTAEVMDAVRRLPAVFVDRLEPAREAIARIAIYAVKARRLGVMSLEEDLAAEPDDFLRRALGLAVDGTSQSQLRAALEIEMDSLAEADEAPARVFDAAGGYAPTIGILGAVIGLIHVMENLAEPSKLGAGIAVAFVATLYGVGSANLVLLPIATKLRIRAASAARRREMLVHGVLAIQDGMNPRILEERLTAFEAVPNRRPSGDSVYRGLPLPETRI